MASNPLVGSWRLVSFQAHEADGSITYPWGEGVHGYITYTDWGRMSVVFQKIDRPRSESDDKSRGTTAEKAAAFDTSMAYSGTYDVEGDRVVHHVEVCIFQNYVGTDLVRVFKLDGNRVSLTTPTTPFGGTTSFRTLVWERV